MLLNEAQGEDSRGGNGGSVEKYETVLTMGRWLTRETQTC